MPKGQALEELNRRQCLDRLLTVRVGRLVFTEDALPAVQPMNFRVWREDVAIRVAGGAWPPPRTISSWHSRLMSWIRTCAQAGV